jgi:hypothetical protein
MDIGLSTRAIEAKAAVLWDRATALSRKCPDAQRTFLLACYKAKPLNRETNQKPLNFS